MASRQLERLAGLGDRGILPNEEFEAEKAKIIADMEDRPKIKGHRYRVPTGLLRSRRCAP